MTDAEHEWPLGERVRNARGKESQKSVAKRANVSPELLWQIEAGRRRDGAVSKPKPASIIAVARALEIPATEALRLAGYKPEHYISATPTEGLEVELARKVSKLRPEQQQALEILVDGLLEQGGHVSGGSMDVVVHSGTERPRVEVQSRGERAVGAGSTEPARQDD